MNDVMNPVDRLNELIRNVDLAMLTTVRPDGSLHSCPMVTQQADADGVLWFFSGTKTEKVEAIRSDARVCVSYADPRAGNYVSVTGYAELVRDTAKNRELWKPEYASWFPGGVDSPNLILLRVLVLSAEYWDGQGGMANIDGFGKEVITNRNYKSLSYREIEFKENQTDRNR